MNFSHKSSSDTNPPTVMTSLLSIRSYIKGISDTIQEANTSNTRNAQYCLERMRDIKAELEQIRSGGSGQGFMRQMQIQTITSLPPSKPIPPPKFDDQVPTKETTNQDNLKLCADLKAIDLVGTDNMVKQLDQNERANSFEVLRDGLKDIYTSVQNL